MPMVHKSIIRRVKPAVYDDDSVEDEEQKQKNRQGCSRRGSVRWGKGKGKGKGVDEDDEDDEMRDYDDGGDDDGGSDDDDNEEV